jgi:uncharacterized OB-fold protein
MSMPEFPRPATAEPAELEHWSALDRGALTYQRCSDCRTAWLPPQAECPNCLSSEWAWEGASGRGTVIASTVFHRAYHPAFESAIPYSASLVELEEGPRLLTNVIGFEPGKAPEPGTEVKVEITRGGEFALATFRATAPTPPAGSRAASGGRS